MERFHWHTHTCLENLHLHRVIESVNLGEGTEGSFNQDFGVAGTDMSVQLCRYLLPMNGISCLSSTDNIFCFYGSLS